MILIRIEQVLKEKFSNHFLMRVTINYKGIFCFCNEEKIISSFAVDEFGLINVII